MAILITVEAGHSPAHREGGQSASSSMLVQFDADGVMSVGGGGASAV
jgi:hypothetical protein